MSKKQMLIGLTPPGLQILSNYRKDSLEPIDLSLSLFVKSY